MPSNHSRATSHITDLLETKTPESLIEQLKPKHHESPPRVPGGTRLTSEALARRWDVLNMDEAQKSIILDQHTFEEREVFQKNIENFIGTVKVPIGLVGPLRVNGLFAQGDYYVPLATTEAALVASYNRGAQVITEAGGCSVALISEGISRAPSFAFRDLSEAGQFVVWAISQLDKFIEVAATTTRHGKLVDMRTTIEGNHVYINFEYITGDASGQNMVTISTEAVCHYIEENSPVKPQYWFIETNMSGDKKANALSFTSVRGKKVTAEVRIPEELVVKRLHTTPDAMVKHSTMGTIASALIGSFGVQGHYANGLAAMFMACGQDVACVAESAIGISRLEIQEDGALYGSVMLPNLMVGTVGGGTSLPSQRVCLEMMGLAGAGKARALAEVCAALTLAGELSINGALSCHQFTRAHQRLARGRHSTAAGEPVAT
ncbi:MAG: hydroxymethylglutaryl-CoA reductase [Candidatus Obscuribacterales bacterium]|nr:hydroxymethylglutaryl-CoA reductase [Candidatus Obscuribacterales bacterium]